MQLIRTIEDAQYGATTKVYQLPNGTRLVHTTDPKTIDTKLDVIFKAGALYEPYINTPNGTAHLLEHLICNPNKEFKTKKALDKFKFGDKNNPALFTNATTSRFKQSFYGVTNSQGEKRLGKYIFAQIDNTIENITKSLEQERKIVIAERNRYPKRSESVALQFLEFIFKKDPSYSSHIIGEVEEIHQITKADIENAWSNLLTQDRAIITIQSGGEISSELLKYVEKIDISLSSRHSNLPPAKEHFENEYRFFHHKDTQAQGISIDFIKFNEFDSQINYQKRASMYLAASLVSKVVKDQMREKKGYIYSSESLSLGGYALDYDLVGFSFTCGINDFLKAINEFNKILEKNAVEYIKTKSGAQWLEGEISTYIFPNTLNFNRDYAYSIGFDLLHDHEVWEFEKMKKAVLNCKVNEIIKVINNFRSTPTQVFITSDQENNQVEKLYLKSAFHKIQQKLS